MPRKKLQEIKLPIKKFRLEYKNITQKLAYSAFDQHDILFMIGPAGVGKTLLSVAFAINEILNRRKDRLVISRPIMEAGEHLGFLPGTFEEKVDPYMLPFYDSLFTLLGKNNIDRERIDKSLEIAPLAYLRGRNLTDSVCILDEAQNATFSQLRLYLTRLGENSKMIINADPTQSDLPGTPAICEVVDKLSTQPGIGIVEFSSANIVRHPLVGKILDKLK